MKAVLHRSAQLLISILLSVVVNNCFASADPPVIKILDGAKGQLHADSTVTVDDKLFDPTYTGQIDTPFYVKNIITFRINEDTNRYLISAFTATVNVRIIYTLPNSSIDSVDTALAITYNPAHDSLYKSRNSFIFNGAHRVKVKIISYTVSQAWATKSLILENEMQPWPNYKFTCIGKAVKMVSVSLAPSGDSSQIKANWTTKIGADQYDVEWTYVDSAAVASNKFGNPVNANLLFDDNATRVQTSESFYNIPLIFPDAGTLFVRVRPVQIKPNGTRIAANWSSDTVTGLASYVFSGHQTNINWQSTISFAEEGKRKVVVQYYDGSLRGRQTVTEDNSTGRTIVAEIYYDFQGRPTIQVLPAPTLNKIIQYTQNFNRINGGEYDRGIYDTLTDPTAYCDAAALAMDTSYGAALYYSPKGDTSNFNKYIPNAHGYVFTQTEYTQDNTGRISRQSGVGETFKLGGGHETKYYYGTADQNEIDALFGTEAGNSTHYFKNMVQDANGQFSVSYVDMQGRTIATALAGTKPTGMDTLSSYNSAVLTETLADSTSNVTTDYVMLSKKSLLLSKAGKYTFNYNLSPDSLKKAACNNSLISYNCLYDLEIKITSDCNNQNMPNGVAFDTIIHKFSLGLKDTSGFHLKFQLQLKAGNFEVAKKLSVSQPGLEYYRDSVFMLKNTCRTVKQFIDSTALAQLHSECEPSCTSCYANLGTIDSFRNHFMVNAGIAATDTAGYRSQIITAYNAALDACKALCDSGTSEQLDIRSAMLRDVSAPSGQYANVDAIDSFSVFYKATLSSVPKYQSGSIVYREENGLPDSVYDDASGKKILPQQLTQEQFGDQFKTSWAEALLPFHPEYCKLQEYQNHHGSVNWDSKFSKVKTYADANSLGYLNPTATASTPFNHYTTITANRDSLAIESSGAYRSRLEDSIQHYRQVTISGTSTYISLWTMAAMSAKCGSDSACKVHLSQVVLGLTAYHATENKILPGKASRDCILILNVILLIAWCERQPVQAIQTIRRNKYIPLDTRPILTMPRIH